MSIYDIISDKKAGKPLSEEQIRFAVLGYTKGEIPDYQMTSLLMAICLRGMNDEETAILTDVIAKSGDNLDFSRFGNLTADKHSTGGVGDKTTLIVGPIAAAAGVKVAKMSGRGLGHTGGTVDKLESIPGYQTSLSPEAFMAQVENVGIAVIGQSGDLAPADKKIYALRDVTATVDSVPLIASSVMGKKLAAGSKNIVLDVKYGSGAFMKKPKDAKTLAKAMVDIGKRLGRNMTALISGMDVPLGSAVGNDVEVKEAIDVLQGRGPSDLTEVCLTLATLMIASAKNMPIAAAKTVAAEKLKSGEAYTKFCEWITAQGGDVTAFGNKKQASVLYEVKAPKTGYISRMDTEKIGTAAVLLGAGRKTIEDSIDHAAGIMIEKKTGDFVKEGDVLAVLETNDEKTISAAKDEFLSAIEIGNKKPKKSPLIYKIIQ